MYTIDNNTTYELIIKNSKFIALAIKIDNPKQADIYINQSKIDYPNATHYCYAYICNDIKKFKDDGEPSGTAGQPILKVLENYQLTNTLIIVIRYFGGRKLGANGLIRAYTKCSANVIKQTSLLLLTDGFNIDITFDYSTQKEIDYFIQETNTKIINKTFNNQITYNIDITNESFNLLNKKNIQYQINKPKKIEK